MKSDDARFARWIDGIERRHLTDLTFGEVSSGLRALSSTYVERRHRLAEGAALAGAGKRAAFALFYGPLHFLLLREIVQGLPGALRRVATLVDLGCGTGASGAAWASAIETPPRVIGVDRAAWTLREAADTYHEFGLSARTLRADLATVALPKNAASIVAAFSMNELPDLARNTAMARLLRRAEAGNRVLIVEPIASVVSRWWDAWRRPIEGAGGRADEWRFQVELPTIVAKLDRAAGLDHRELTARSFWIG